MFELCLVCILELCLVCILKLCLVCIQSICVQAKIRADSDKRVIFMFFARSGIRAHKQVNEGTFYKSVSIKRTCLVFSVFDFSVDVSWKEYGKT